MRSAILILAMNLAACATCERHPIACTAAVGVVATSIALSRGSDSTDESHRAFYQLKGMPR
jgi:hypothetical protein